MSDVTDMASSTRLWTDLAAVNGPGEHLPDEWQTLTSPQAGLDSEQVMLCAARITDDHLGRTDKSGDERCPCPCLRRRDYQTAR